MNFGTFSFPTYKTQYAVFVILDDILRQPTPKEPKESEIE
jgi:hypothetical protein